MAYITQEEQDLALNLNFEIQISVQKGARFNRGDRYIWPVMEAWQTADLIDGSYCNHQKFKSLTDALNRDV